MNKTYAKPVINVTKLEAEDIIATSGIFEAPKATITKADGTTVSNMTQVETQDFNSIYKN